MPRAGSVPDERNAGTVWIDSADVKLPIDPQQLETWPDQALELDPEALSVWLGGQPKGTRDAFMGQAASVAGTPGSSTWPLASSASLVQKKSRGGCPGVIDGASRLRLYE
jgi:hypothetical protein